MRTALNCTTQPTAFVALADVKVQLKIANGDNSKDDLVNALIGAVCGHLDGADGSLKRAVSAQAWCLVLNSFRVGSCPPWRIELPLPPVRAVQSVKYYDAAGVLQTLDPSAYRLVNRGTERSRLVPTTGWPSAQRRDDAVQIAFTAGYGADEGQVPMPKVITQAVILMVKQLYDMGDRNAFLASDDVQGVGAKTYFAEGAINVIESAVDNLLFNIRLPG